MSSPSRETAKDDKLDVFIAGALRDSVSGREPSPRVREALLRAARDGRRRAAEAAVEVYRASFTHAGRSGSALAWDEEQSPGDASVSIGMLQSHMLRVRFVV